MATNLPRVMITKPVGALVSITRRTDNASNTVAVTVNKNTAVTAQNEGTSPAITPATPTVWRAGVWR